MKENVNKKVKKVKENTEAASAKKAKAKPEKDKTYTDSQRKDLIIYMSSGFIYRICIQNF